MGIALLGNREHMKKACTWYQLSDCHYTVRALAQTSDHYNYLLKIRISSGHVDDLV